MVNSNMFCTVGLLGPSWSSWSGKSTVGLLGPSWSGKSMVGLLGSLGLVRGQLV